jgi:aldehyde:ferredoxin oxidoreductase
MVGQPPLTAGPLQGVTVDLATLVREFLEFLGWDTHTAVPSAASLRKLGMGFLVGDFHGR